MTSPLEVRLLSFPDCPHVEAARRALRHALTRAGLPIAFEEIDISAPDVPDSLTRWGSPTVLVNARDVAEGAPRSGGSCRLYETASGVLQGAPSVEMIERALARVSASRNDL